MVAISRNIPGTIISEYLPCLSVEQSCVQLPLRLPSRDSQPSSVLSPQGDAIRRLPRKYQTPRNKARFFRGPNRQQVTSGSPGMGANTLQSRFPGKHMTKTANTSELESLQESKALTPALPTGLENMVSPTLRGEQMGLSM